MSVTAKTISTTLRPIDSEGLEKFAAKGRENPENRGTKQSPYGNRGPVPDHKSRQWTSGRG